MKRIFGAKSKLLVSILALICIMAVGGTMAYLFAKTDPVTNSFSSAELDTGIVETGEGINKTVQITNKGESPAWVRARLLVSGIDPENVVILQASGDVGEGQLGLVMPNRGDGKWQSVSNYNDLQSSTDGGWIYYQSPLATGVDTPALLQGVVFGEGVDPDDISITVTHESVLALDATADGWQTAFDDPVGGTNIGA